MTVTRERLFVFMLLASAIVVGIAFFLPVEYELGFKRSAERSPHDSHGASARTGHVVRYEQSFSDDPTPVDIVVFSLPIVLALLLVVIRGKVGIFIAAMAPLVLLALLVVLGFNVMFFGFDLFSSQAPVKAYGGVLALGAMAASVPLSVLVLAAKLRNRRAAG